MKKIYTYIVKPALPEALNKLRELAYNLYWCWHHDVIDLFRRIDRDLWEEVENNPVMLLGRVSQKRIEEIANDNAFQANLRRVYDRFSEYVKSVTWFDMKCKDRICKDFLIAYFSAEFGISESLPIYSGGLGILSGDHLKSCSDLGIPIVGVGLLYQQGYFSQYLNSDGWQQEEYSDNDFYNLPIEEVSLNGSDLIISVSYPGRDVYAKVWKVQIGRIPLYLLDTNIEENSLEDRSITYQLYGGDKEMRLKQEIMLGIGGVKMLNALNKFPTVCHMNDGHSAFLCFEKIKILREKYNLDPKVAIEASAAGNIFTTHTPVPAGFDIFPQDMMRKYFSSYAEELGISIDELLSCGRGSIYNSGEDFNMAVLAFKNASFSNGVSRLHAKTSRKLFNQLMPSIPVNETPISSVTNGIHTSSWLSKDMALLLSRYLGEDILLDPSNVEVWERIKEIPAEELWMVHQHRKERLITTVRKLLKKQMERRGASSKSIDMAAECLSLPYLTIGFARRFTGYKRATLILHDKERLKNIINNREMPVQFVFAGKAHPRDEEGKRMIKEIFHFSMEEDVKKRFVFIEDYDIKIARYIFSGVDVWLNTPLRPLEASGTSGMKVVPNGGLNLSILDGWWDEAYDPEVGWAIGKGEVYDNIDYQNKVESETLYNLIEREIAPLFYERNAEGLPRGWIDRMKKSIIKLAPVFNTHRMTKEYVEHFYIPASERYTKLSANNFEKAKNLASWRQDIFLYWKDVRIIGAEAEKKKSLKVGDWLEVTAEVYLGRLEPKSIRVDAYNGPLDSKGNIVNGHGTPLSWVGEKGGGTHIFRGKIYCKESGKHGFTIRVFPTHRDLPKPVGFFEILWQ